jgi:hypothetical protein
MKPAQQVADEALTEPTRLELWLQKPGGAARWPLLTAAVLAAFFTTAAAGFSLHLSRDYYAVAPYHYDSAAYRVQALRAYEALEARGLGAALQGSLREKDSLDVTLRLLFAPRTLLLRYGHFVVLLPFLAFFLFLLLRYVSSRTRSWLLALAAGSALFVFPLPYDVFWGIADCWKDNLATWLLGAAALAWLQSEGLRLRRWNLLCGLLLGLLLMQRSVAAVYAAILFLPLLLYAARLRIRSDGLRPALVRLAALGLPALLLGMPLLVLQWSMLRSYYLVRGWAYARPSAVALYLFHGLFRGVASAPSGFGGQLYGMNFAPLFIAALYASCALAVPRRRWPRAEFVTAGWLLAGLPLAVIFTRAYFHGFFALWTALLVVCLGVLLPRTLAPAASRTFALAVLLFTASAASAQFYVAVRTSRTRTMAEHFEREIVAQIVPPIAASPAPHRYALLFGGADAPLINQALFDFHVRLPSDEVRLPFRDVEMARAVKGMSEEQVVQAFVGALEQQPGAIAVGWCRVEDVPRWPNDPVSSRVTLVVNRHLLESDRWKAIRRIRWASTSCLNVYEAVASPLTEAAKWKDLAFASAPSEIPVALPVGTGARLYDYVSRYPPENANGVYVQWLPSGPGLHLTLFSDENRFVTFEARAVPGPSRGDRLRTLVASGPAGGAAVTVRGDELVRVPLHLAPGLTRIDFSVRETADVSPPGGGDQRELMLLLESPRLMPAPR